MPWCPNCKAEYQQGFTVCSDCKVELVDDIREAEILVPCFQCEDKKIAEKLVKFFNYSDLSSSMEYEEENDLYIVSVPPKKQLLAKQLYQAFDYVEKERMEHGENDLLEEIDSSDDKSETQSDEAFSMYNSLDPDETWNDEEGFEAVTPGDEITAFDNETKSSSAYVMKEDQYKDLTGTVWIFLFFGVVGLIIVGLNVIGILSFFNGWIPNLVMGAMFACFLYVAVSTNKKAKKVQTEIDGENKLTKEINEWLKVNITESFLSSIHNDSVSEELNYLKATDTIKDMLVKEFENQNLAYLDRLIEEFYNENF